jgi:2-keto-3-deoxy-6-phosphogluconate aldolase
MNRSEVRAQIEEVGILPFVRVTSEEHAQFAAETVFAAGIPRVEIALTVPGIVNIACIINIVRWSGRRDSNPRSQVATMPFS